MTQRIRVYPANVPFHIVHRGVDRQPVFFETADRERFLGRLERCATRHYVSVHAYVLMDNHVHLLATSGVDGAISRMMRDTSSYYVPRTNRQRNRTGTLWEGRHYSARIDSERYLLACSRYIEMNPVRAGMIRHPGATRWSSFRANALGVPDAVISPHSVYVALGRDPATRQREYARLFDPTALEEADLDGEAPHFRSTLKRVIPTGHPEDPQAVPAQPRGRLEREPTT